MCHVYVKNRATIRINIQGYLTIDFFFELGMKKTSDAKLTSKCKRFFEYIIFSTTKTNFVHFSFANEYRSAFDNSFASLFRVNFARPLDEYLLKNYYYFRIHCVLFSRELQIAEMDLNIIIQDVESLGLVSTPEC